MMLTARPGAAASAQEAAQAAVAVVGCGYDLTSDLRLSWSKERLVELDNGDCRDLTFPGGVIVPGVPSCVRCDKGERMRLRSDVLSFHQMSEHFNKEMGLSGKIPMGPFNAAFDLLGCWHKDALNAKSLALDGFSVVLYAVELASPRAVLRDSVKDDVPIEWDPIALAEFIEKYGTHIITGVKMGGKDVYHIKQSRNSSLQPNELQKILKKLADESFSVDANANGCSSIEEVKRKFREYQNDVLSARPVISRLKNEDTVTIHIRRGGLDYNQSHNQWLSTVSMAPDVISMMCIPIISLLNGVRGSGFLIHAMNLYLRYKPPREGLQQFFEFQLPRQWAPVYSELPLGCQRTKEKLPSLKFTILGPKLRVSTEKVISGNRPVTGIRLYLEGKKNDLLAVHLQHLSALPNALQLSEDSSYDPYYEEPNTKAYYEPVRWSIFSHICTAPIQYNGARIDDSASIVTKAWLEVKEIELRKVLFLRLGFSNVVAAKIRRSEWDGPSGSTASLSKKSGSISALLGGRSASGPFQSRFPPKVDMNSAVYPGGPPAPISESKMSRFVDTSETVRGPEDTPGYWMVTGAKLSLEFGKISVKAKYSLLTIITEDDDLY